MFIGSAPRCRSSLFEIICALGSGFSTICGRSFTCLADPGFAAFATGCDAFAALVAKRCFELTAAAIKAADPNHLILGCHFAYKPSSGVIDAAGRHCDVISFNCYDPGAGGRSFRWRKLQFWNSHYRRQDLRRTHASDGLG